MYPQRQKQQHHTPQCTHRPFAKALQNPTRDAYVRGFKDGVHHNQHATPYFEHHRNSRIRQAYQDGRVDGIAAMQVAMAQALTTRFSAKNEG